MSQKIQHCFSNNLIGYRCNTETKKYQVKIKDIKTGFSGTETCKINCENNLDCKGFYTRKPEHFIHNTVCYHCIGADQGKSIRRSSRVKDYHIPCHVLSSSASDLPPDETIAFPLAPSLPTCPENHYKQGSNCKTCPSGFVSNKGSSGLSSCEQLICPKNQYSEAHVCKSCPAWFVSKKGSSGLSSCQKIICPENQYDSGNGCKTCPGRKISPTGSVGVNACYTYCPENQYDSGNGCTMCPPGTKGGTIGISSCEKITCPANSYYWQQRDRCVFCANGLRNPAYPMWGCN